MALLIPHNILVVLVFSDNVPLLPAVPYLGLVYIVYVIYAQIVSL